MNRREDIKIQVQQATDIVDLIGEQIALKPAGREFVCVCPFHDDHNPSMHVVPQKQIYKCFSCGAGGDVFSFAMNYHKMTFPEALRHLADRAGIEIRDDDRQQGDGPSDSQLIADANARALAFFQRTLAKEPDAQVARDYIAQRGISEDMVKAFGLGYAPGGWSAMTDFLRQRQFPTAGFEKAGLLSKSDRSGKLYDRFRHRLMFPICDHLGRPIAFGGRVLPGGDESDPTRDAKYLNSHEHALFNKSTTLYGLHLAKKPIIDAGEAIIVEGYTDVIACHQAGVANVVATLGTALTRDHAKRLKRFAERVVLIFDADEAGQKAADRALEIFLNESIEVSIAVLPDGVDPADLMAREDGVAQWHEAVGAARDALDYQFDRFHAQLDEQTTVTGRQRVAEAYVQRLAAAGLDKLGMLRRSLVVQRLADQLQLPAHAVEDMLKRHAPRRPSTASGSPSGTSAPSQIAHPSQRAQAESMRVMDDGPDLPVEGDEADMAYSLPPVASTPRAKALRAAERHLIGCLLHDGELFHLELDDGRHLDETIAPSDLIAPDASRLFEVIYDLLASGENLAYASLLSELAERDERGLTNLATQCEREVDAIVTSDSEIVELPELFIHCVQLIRDHVHQQELDRVKSEATTETSDLLLARLAEHHRNHPSKRKMPVIRN